MFVVKLMKGDAIHLYYAERAVVHKPEHDDRSVWFKWVETAEGGGTAVFEERVYVDAEQFDFAVIEQHGKTVDVIRSQTHDQRKRSR